MTVVVLFVGASVWIPVSGAGPFSRPTLDVVFLDVGQGDAAVVRTPQGKTVLVDAGRRSRYSDAGRHAVLPFLASQGIDRLDAVVITHPDGDHLGGLPAILRAVPVGRVLHSGQRAHSDLFVESRHVLDSLDVAHDAVDAGDTLAVDSSVRIQVLGPPEIPDRHGIHSENDASVVLHVAYGSTDVLLTGDVEAAGEQWLVDQYGDQMASDVVKAAHHGSSTSSTPGFVDAATETRASIRTRVVVSVGRKNAYGMPDESVLTRWEAHNASIHQTAAAGTIWMRSDGIRMWQRRWK